MLSNQVMYTFPYSSSHIEFARRLERRISSRVPYFAFYQSSCFSYGLDSTQEAISPECDLQ